MLVICFGGLGGCASAPESGQRDADTPVAAPAVPIKYVAPIEANLADPQPIPTLVMDDSVVLSWNTQLNLRADLKNISTAPIRLTAATPCAVFDWAVVTADTHAVVQREPSVLCQQAIEEQVLLPNDTVSREYALPLDEARYKPGKRYALRYTFWNFWGEQVFTVE